jgi:hypothetical protein
MDKVAVFFGHFVSLRNNNDIGFASHTHDDDLLLVDNFQGCGKNSERARADELALEFFDIFIQSGRRKLRV